MPLAIQLTLCLCCLTLTLAAVYRLCRRPAFDTHWKIETTESKALVPSDLKTLARGLSVKFGVYHMFASTEARQQISDALDLLYASESYREEP